MVGQPLALRTLCDLSLRPVDLGGFGQDTRCQPCGHSEGDIQPPQ